MQGRRRTIRALVVLTAVSAALALAGCSETIDETIANDVTNRSFTFADGRVFHPALANKPTTLSFTDGGATFTLTASDGMATGTARFRPCSLTVDPAPAGSTFASFATGPQGDDVLILSTCDFDITAQVLILGNGTVIISSSPAVALESNG